jgi:hypothetical protein
MIPDEVMAEHRASALRAEGRPVSRAGAAAIIAVWITAALLGSWLTWRYFSN